MSTSINCGVCLGADVMWTPYGTQSPTMRFRFEMLAHDTSPPPAAGAAAPSRARPSRSLGLMLPGTAAESAPAPRPASTG